MECLHVYCYCSILILGFSRQMVELLNKQGAKYSHFDILTDNDVRQGNKHVIDKNIVHVITNSLFL